MAVSTNLSSSYEFIKSVVLSTIFPVNNYVKDFVCTRPNSSEVRPGLANLEIYRKLQESTAFSSMISLTMTSEDPPTAIIYITRTPQYLSKR